MKTSNYLWNCWDWGSNV